MTTIDPAQAFFNLYAVTLDLPTIARIDAAHTLYFPGSREAETVVAEAESIAISATDREVRDAAYALADAIAQGANL